MGKRNNPAAGLQAVLIKGRDAKLGGKAVHAVWSELLRVEPQNRHLLLSRLGKVYQLPAQIKGAITQVEGLDHEVYLNWMPKVEKAFSISNLDVPWQQLIGPIDDHVIYGLGICSEVLSRMSAEPTIPEEQLQKIRTQVTQLIDEILKTATINRVLSRFMLDRLMAILEAIDCQDLTGTEPITTAIHAAVGALPFAPESVLKNEECPQRDKFWNIIGRIAIVLALCHDGVELAERCKTFALPAPMAHAAESSTDSIHSAAPQ